MHKISPQSSFFKTALLSISLMLMSSSQISPSLPLMYADFPQISRTGVELLSSIAGSGIVVGLCFNPLIVQLVKPKATIILGLLLVLIAGSYPIYATNYGGILTARFLLGVGVGLYNSLAVSLLAQFYQGPELSTMLGWQNATGSLGIALFSGAVSWLLNWGWHAAFAIYLLALPILLLFSGVVSLPAAPSQPTMSAAPSPPWKQLNWTVLRIAGLMFFMHAFFMTQTFKLPQLAWTQHLASVQQVALISGLVGLMGWPVGLIYGKLKQKLQALLLPISLLLQVGGLLIMAYAPQIVVLVIGAIILGTGFGLAVPYAFDWVAAVVPEAAVNLATTVVLILINLGCTISPLLVNWLATTGSDGSPQAAFSFAAGGMGLLTLYGLGHYWYMTKIHRQKV